MVGVMVPMTRAVSTNSSSTNDRMQNGSYCAGVVDLN